MLENCALCFFCDPLTPKIRMLILHYICYIIPCHHSIYIIERSYMLITSGSLRETRLAFNFELEDLIVYLGGHNNID